MGNSFQTLHSYLEALLPNVTLYFQPPESIKLEYPCLIYRLDNVFSKNADNVPYIVKNRYSLTLITKKVEEDMYYKLLSLESAKYERLFIADGLYHLIVTIHSFLT